MFTHDKIHPANFSDKFFTDTELSSVALGGKVIAVSDDFFAEAFHLLEVDPAPSLHGQFGPKGALYSGWETRRHNPTYDWCIIKLGTSGFISGFDIDTTHFNGNEAPEASVQALFASDGQVPSSDDTRWSEILQKVALRPNSRHLFKIESEAIVYNYVKLNIYPDGGIARFRVYGLVQPIFPEDIAVIIDLAHVFSGGRIVFISDQHYGIGSNLLLPGRGKDMRDGWETKRSRTEGHKDWAIIKLGTAGFLEHVEIDTAHYMGNFPESCELHALQSNDVIPAVQEEEWISVLPRTKLGPHRRHSFHLDNVRGKLYTHVRLTIHPDGGVKRVRILGRRALTECDTTNTVVKPSLESEGDRSSTSASYSQTNGMMHEPTVPALMLTPEAFAPFGQVIQAWSDVNATPRGIKVTPANQGSASKFHKLSLIQSSYPPGCNATSGLSVYRCKPLDIAIGQDWAIRILERHPCTNQAFIPMGAGVRLSEDALDKAGRAYLVVVAINGEDDRPDLQTLRAFVANAGQGIVYNQGVWHHPMVSLETTIDFTCVETQIGNGDNLDCEILELDRKQGLPLVKIPFF